MANNPDRTRTQVRNEAADALRKLYPECNNLFSALNKHLRLTVPEYGAITAQGEATCESSDTNKGKRNYENSNRRINAKTTR